MQFFSLDQLLPGDHRARLVWGFVRSLNLEPLYEEIRVTDSQAGRTAIAPEILVALWLQATLPSVPIMNETTASLAITVEGMEVVERWRKQGC